VSAFPAEAVEQRPKLETVWGDSSPNRPTTTAEHSQAASPPLARGSRVPTLAGVKHGFNP
jgi:hypothetical protein